MASVPDLPAAVPKRKRTTGRPCKCCNHSELAEIDRELIAGTPLQTLSRRFAIDHEALSRHRDNHMPQAALAEAAEARAAAEGARGSDLLDDAHSLRKKALSLLSQAEAAGDLRTALHGVREAARCLELEGKLRGELDDGIHLSILVAPALSALQTTILQALGPYPEARQACVVALSGMSGGPPLLEHDG